MRTFTCLVMLLTAVPVLAAEADPKPESGINMADLVFLVAAGSLCKPAVANAEAVEAALQVVDDARPSDVRGLIFGQQEMLLQEAQVQPAIYTDNICAAARDIAFRHGLD